MKDVNVPTGYKSTDVGVIPKDWKVKKLKKEIISLEAGVSVNSLDNDLSIYSHNYCILKTSAIHNGIFYLKECKKTRVAK